ncbi:caspase family protein [Flammeovirga sp. SubArs3]|uniref:caspase family protein n=1 Tax=Flammeovirga sp. SubArs3 TaxID=2995316 RepID=UPI00248BF140|nr:caspase family protein [Flammeovirga sp. SubArs3]
MKRLLITLFVFTLSTLSIFSQNDRGLVLNEPQSTSQKKIKAVIVGVSEYSNFPQEAQLQFADDDATAFANFLIEHKAVAPEDIKLLVNKEATQANVQTQIIKTLMQGQEGEEIIIYFAGHGDVDMVGDAYLLANDALAKDEEGYMMGIGGSLQLSQLKKYVNSLSSKKGFKVLMVTDACRSGELLSSDGTDSEFSQFYNDWNNTHKYVSCGPNELSKEGLQWGNGHGAFTFHLLQGLMGLADSNGDNKIYHGELNSYITSKVPAETDYDQNPQYKGIAKEIVMVVDDKLKDLALQNQNNFNKTSVASRGVSPNNGLLKYKDTFETRSFYDAIASQRIIEPKYLHENEVLDIEFTNDIQIGNIKSVKVSGNKAWVFSKAKTIEIFNFETNEKEIVQAMSYPSKIAANGDYWAYYAKDQTTYLYHKTFQFKTASYHKSPVTALTISKNGTVYSGDEKGNVFLMDKEDTPPKKVHKVKNQVSSIAVSDDEKFIAVSDAKGSLVILDGKTLNPIAEEKISPKSEREMFFARNGDIIVTINYATIKFTDTKSGKTIRDIGLPAREKPRKISPLNDKFFLVLGENSNLFIVNAKSGKAQKVSTHPLGQNFKWDSDSELMASISTTTLKLASVTVPTPYATEWFEKIYNSPLYDETQKEDLKSLLAVALQDKAQKIITPFILGKSVTPSIVEVKEGIHELNYATRLYKNEPEILEMINIRRWFLQGYLIIIENNVKDFPKAISYFEKILEVTPTAAYPHNGIAIINKKLMKLDKTKESVKIAEELKPKWTAPKNTMVKTYVVEENYEEALKKNEEIIAIIPNNVKGYLGKATIYLEMGYYQKAWSLVKKMETIDPSNPAFTDIKAAVLLELGQLKQAYDVAQGMMNQSQKVEDSYITYANIMRKIYDRQDSNSKYLLDAEKVLLSGIEEFPTSADLKAILGKLYTSYASFYKKSPKKVYDLIDQALILDPYNAVALRYKAQFAVQVENNYPKAKESTDKYTSKRGQFSDLDIFLAYVAYSRQDLKAIERHSKVSLLKNPYRLENYKLLWNTYVELGKEDKLHELYLMGKDMLPDTPWFDYKYGLFFKGKKQNGKASSYIATALRIAPQYNYAYVMRSPTNGIKKLYGYDKIQPKNGFYLVSKNGNEGVIDYAGRLVVPIEYSNIQLKQNGYSLLTFSDGQMQLNSPDGKIIGGKKFDSIEFMECGLIKVQEGNLFGCLDRKTGQLRVPIKYEKITNGRWSGKPTACCRYSLSDSDRSADFYDGSGQCVSCD